MMTSKLCQTKKNAIRPESDATSFGICSRRKAYLQCSHEVAYRFAKCKKPHTIADELMKPRAGKMIVIMIGSGAKKNIHQVSLSNDTIRRRIDDMAANVCQLVCSEIKQSLLQTSIQLDESTNSALESHLIALAQYDKDGKVNEKFLFSNTLSATTTAADVKTLLHTFF